MVFVLCVFLPNKAVSPLTVHRYVDVSKQQGRSLLSMVEGVVKERSNRARMTNHPLIVGDVAEATNGEPVLGTHDGTFHCDEVLALSMLRLLPAYQDACIVRSRDPAQLAKCHIVVDVGAEYNAPTFRFDHHQRGFTETLVVKEDDAARTGSTTIYKTKLSSAGLIYQHFGMDVIRAIVHQYVAAGKVKIVPDEKAIKKIYHKVYVEFVEHIDGIDNGVTISERELRYKVETSLPSRVGRLNPSWNEEAGPASINTRFASALELVGHEFVGFVTGLIESWWPARQIVAKAFQDRLTAHASGQVMVLSQFCPWTDHLFDLEVEHKLQGTLKYVLYQDSKGGWRIQAVPTEPGSFLLRLALPEKWRGLRDQLLSDACGIPSCVFIHANGFIGGCADVQGALRLAELSLLPVS